MTTLSTSDILVIAALAHEANRAYCLSIGDASQPSWADAPLWQRDSAIAGVRFTLDHPQSTPADVHASWLAAKVADGWRWGPTKDPSHKLHPCILPYDKLALEQRTKDVIFQAVVRGASTRLTRDLAATPAP